MLGRKTTCISAIARCQQIRHEQRDATDGCEDSCPIVADGRCDACSVASTCTSFACDANKFNVDNNFIKQMQGWLSAGRRCYLRRVLRQRTRALLSPAMPISLTPTVTPRTDAKTTHPSLWVARATRGLSQVSFLLLNCSTFYHFRLRLVCCPDFIYFSNFAQRSL